MTTETYDCGLCGRMLPTGSTAYLCRACTSRTDKRLAALPGFYRLLAIDLAPSMATRFEGRVSGGGGAAPLPLNEDVLELRMQTGLVDLLEDWRRAMHAALGWGVPARTGTVEDRVHAAVKGLRENLLWIADAWFEAGQFAKAIRVEHDAIESIVAPRAQPKRLGLCMAKVDGVLCGAVIRLEPGAATARCRWCEAEYPPATWMALLAAQAGLAAAA